MTGGIDGDQREGADGAPMVMAGGVLSIDFFEFDPTVYRPLGLGGVGQERFRVAKERYLKSTGGNAVSVDKIIPNRFGPSL